VFSACFGKPFLPLHPTKYAEMLGRKLEECRANVWLINTGWSGGSYGVGKRINLAYTRAMITAALAGELDQVEFVKHPVFGLEMPSKCPGVPDEILNPQNSWKDKKKYDETANMLAEQFIKNFGLYKEFATEEILAGAPISEAMEKTMV
ncbi:MAG TPA: phosphoenolpyruvate carboxykinase (ATP), partial [Bacteroidia bacterium]|nr:phosphoenolpyruvate carboxykinase (ATP) [Bacteroidia bacterium]